MIWTAPAGSGMHMHCQASLLENAKRELAAEQPMVPGRASAAAVFDCDGFAYSRQRVLLRRLHVIPITPVHCDVRRDEQFCAVLDLILPATHFPCLFDLI